MALTWEKHPVDGTFATEIRRGICACGCGQPTEISTRNRRDRGVIKGEPLRYVAGHNAKPSERFCGTCKITKPIQEFSRRKKGSYRVRCDECRQPNEGRRVGAPRRAKGSALVRNEQGHKECRVCLEWKPESEYQRWSLALDGLCLQCRSCRSDMDRLSKYGVSKEQFQSLLEQQDFACAICANPLEGQKICVDHDHSCCPGKRCCGKCVRGLLCDDCNHGLGFFRDSVDRLRCAIKYLENPV